MKTEHIMCLTDHFLLNTISHCITQPNFNSNYITSTPKLIKLIFNPIAIMFIHRELAEQNSDFRQIIPYITIIDQNNNILTYKRNAKAGEERLHYKLSIGIGGHINTTSIIYSSPNNKAQIDINKTFSRGTFKELQEELNITDNETILNLLQCNTSFNIIISDETQVDRVHVGISMIIQLHNKINFILPKQIIEDGLEKFEWISIEQLKNLDIYNQLENWSKIVLHYIESTTPSKD